MSTSSQFMVRKSTSGISSGSPPTIRYSSSVSSLSLLAAICASSSTNTRPPCSTSSTAAAASSGVPPLFRTSRTFLMPFSPLINTPATASSPNPSKTFFNRPSSSPSSASCARNSVTGFCSSGYCCIRLDSLASCPLKKVKSVIAPAVTALAAVPALANAPIRPAAPNNGTNPVANCATPSTRPPAIVLEVPRKRVS